MNWRKINQTLSEEFNLPIKVVESELSGYWSYFRKQLSNPTAQVFRIEGLGSFQINEVRFFRTLARYIIHLRKARAGLIPEKVAPSIIAESLQQIPVLWKLKGILHYRNSSKKQGPKEVVAKELQKKLDNLIHESHDY